MMLSIYPRPAEMLFDQSVKLRNILRDLKPLSVRLRHGLLSWHPASLFISPHTYEVGSRMSSKRWCDADYVRLH